LVGKYLEGAGIIVACFCPGWVKTDMGTENAELTIDQSIPPLIKTISNLTTEKSGGYFTRNGEVIPW
jgi:short-subunit dehydrogenase